MKQFLLIIFFTTTTIFPTFSQVDTTSSMDVLLKQGHDKAQEKAKEQKSADRKFGCSVFGGLGKGGNDQKDGFAYGGSARVHYNIHTVNVYASLATKSEQINGKSADYTLYGSCYGFTYGIGAYDKNVSASIGAGLAYLQTKMIFGGGVNETKVYYDKLGACIGGQFSAHGKYLGFGIQMYFNVTTPVTNYTILAGLEIRLR